MIVNGIGSVVQILVGNIINSCASMLIAMLLLVILNMKVVGAALILPIAAIFLILYGLYLIKKKGIKNCFGNMHADFKLIWDIC